MIDKIEICVAQPHHIERMYQIEKDTFQLPWTKELLFYEITKEDSIVLCAYVNGNMAGFCGITDICGEGHITNVAVDAKYRNKGVGNALISALLSAAEEKSLKNITLEVRISNTAAIHLYEKFGFIGVGVRKKYYIDNDEDAIIMWRLANEEQRGAK